MNTGFFSHAITRNVPDSYHRGLSLADLGPPDLALAREQHEKYIQALESCGLEVQRLPALNDYPDSVFVEDVVLCTGRGAILTRPGAESRRGEVSHLEATILEQFAATVRIQKPGTLDAGDVLMLEDHFYIGESGRTNSTGIQQARKILENWDYAVTTVPVGELLHLKSGVASLGSGLLLVSQELAQSDLFPGLRKYTVPVEETYAANMLYINGIVLMASGFPQTRALLEDLEFEIMELEMSEFQKMDGGLSCLSLRF